MFSGFKCKRIVVNETEINLKITGSGPAVLPD